MLTRVVNDPEVDITVKTAARPSPPSPLRTDIVGPVERLVKEMWPTATVVPEMSTGATDGLDVRNGGIPVYGVGALFGEEGDSREHGRDERVGVDAFHRSTAFWYQLVKALTSGDKTT